MSDKKVSELTLATSVNSADVALIVQGGYSKKLPLSTLFANVPSDIIVQGTISQTGTPETVTSGAISITSLISYVSNTSGSDAHSTLAAGNANAEKTIIATNLATNKMIVTLTGQGFTTLTFNSTGDTAKLIYTNSKWYVLSLRGATIA